MHKLSTGAHNIHVFALAHKHWTVHGKHFEESFDRTNVHVDGERSICYYATPPPCTIGKLSCSMTLRDTAWDTFRSFDRLPSVLPIQTHITRCMLIILLLVHNSLANPECLGTRFLRRGSRWITVNISALHMPQLRRT